MSDLCRYINPQQERVDEYVELEDGLIVNRYGILTTDRICYTVYERTDGPSSCKHSSISRTATHGWLGDVTTRRLPPEINALPAYSDECYQAVKAWYQEREQAAEIAIRKAFPKDFEEEKQEQFTCEKCNKSLHEDEVVPWRTIDPKSGCDTFLTYCETCYKALVNKIYGF